MFDQGIERKLDGNSGVKDDNLAARPQDAEAVMRIEKGTNGLTSGFSNNL